MKNLILFFVVILLSIIQFGCGTNMIRYVMDEPTYSDINIQGISSDDEIIELSDTYNGQANSDSSFWIVVKKEGIYNLGKINVQTGEIRDLNLLQESEYSEDNSIYWDSFVEEDIDAGEACIGGCLSEQFLVELLINMD